MAAPRRWPCLRLAGAALLLSGGAAVAQEPGAAAAAPADDDPPLRLGAELELGLRLVWPKFRVRDGVRALPGTSIRSNEIGVEDVEVGGSGAMRFLVGDERITLSAWFVDATGSGRLGTEERFGGERWPAGTRFDAAVLFRHVEIEWVHRFTPWSWLHLDLGVAAGWTYVEAQLGQLGRTRLHAFYPSPRARITVAPLEGLEVWLEGGGFYVRLPQKDTTISEVFEARGGVRFRWRGFYAELGAWLYTPEIEEDPSDPEEDVVHMRLRGLSFAVGATF